MVWNVSPTLDFKVPSRCSKTILVMPEASITEIWGRGLHRRLQASPLGVRQEVREYVTTLHPSTTDPSSFQSHISLYTSPPSSPVSILSQASRATGQMFFKAPIISLILFGACLVLFIFPHWKLGKSLTVKEARLRCGMYGKWKTTTATTLFSSSAHADDVLHNL